MMEKPHLKLATFKEKNMPLGSISGFPQALEIMENHTKNQCMEKSWNLKKLNNHGNVMEFCEII